MEYQNLIQLLHNRAEAYGHSNPVGLRAFESRFLRPFDIFLRSYTRALHEGYALPEDDDGYTVDYRDHIENNLYGSPRDLGPEHTVAKFWESVLSSYEKESISDILSDLESSFQYLLPDGDPDFSYERDWHGFAYSCFSESLMDALTEAEKPLFAPMFAGSDVAHYNNLIFKVFQYLVSSLKLEEAVETTRTFQRYLNVEDQFNIDSIETAIVGQGIYCHTITLSVASERKQVGYAISTVRNPKLADVKQMSLYESREFGASSNRLLDIQLV